MRKRGAASIVRELENEMQSAGAEILLVGSDTDVDEVVGAYAKLRSSISSSVGVDCEGTEGVKGSRGPLMVQVGSEAVVVVETPTEDGKYSQSLRDLLADKLVTKVFCQGRDDIASLGRSCPPVMVAGPCADLKDVTDLPKNPVPGLAAILSRADPEGASWTKQSFKKKGWWRLQSSEEMLAAPGFVEYAAADAWGTVTAHAMLLGRAAGRGSQPSSSKRARR
mmetsp:Transcript_111326/g.295865  ORF Transcript_111326/g.295865 Transcript_111326/m.295865 type:complete len:223 (-) Transcript_111326:40-708(-)|eukprot:UN3357